MPWVESASASFRARHDASQADEADRVLHSLEVTREYLAEHFPQTLRGATVVLHQNTASLSLARPLLPLAWFLTAPAARRYVAAWGSSGEVHVLSPAALTGRATNVPGSREMLARTAAAAYARLVVGHNNDDLKRAPLPARLRLELRWAWLLEGAGRWFSGQTEYVGPAIARRLREEARPSFPPGVRDALLLGGTVVDLLVQEEGEQAAVRFVCNLHPQGARPALAKAFGGRPFAQTEMAWRSHLTRVASSG